VPKFLPVADMRAKYRSLNRCNSTRELSWRWVKRTQWPIHQPKPTLHSHHNQYPECVCANCACTRVHFIIPRPDFTVLYKAIIFGLTPSAALWFRISLILHHRQTITSMRFTVTLVALTTIAAVMVTGSRATPLEERKCLIVPCPCHGEASCCC
jgi:hypothetical protein